MLSREKRCDTFSEIMVDHGQGWEEVKRGYTRFGAALPPGFICLFTCMYSKCIAIFRYLQKGERESRTPLLLLFTHVDVGRWRAAHPRPTKAKARAPLIHRINRNRPTFWLRPVIGRINDSNQWFESIFNVNFSFKLIRIIDSNHDSADHWLRLLVDQ